MKTPEQTGAEIKANAIRFWGLDGEGIGRIYPVAPFERLCSQFANYVLSRGFVPPDPNGFGVVHKAAVSYGGLLLLRERNYWKIEEHIRLTFHPHLVAMNESCEELARSISEREEKFHIQYLLKEIADKIGVKV